MTIAISILIASQIRNKHRVERKKKKPILTIQKQTKAISKACNKETSNVRTQLQQKVNWTPMFRIPKRTKKNQLKKIFWKNRESKLTKRKQVKTFPQTFPKIEMVCFWIVRIGFFFFLSTLCL